MNLDNLPDDYKQALVNYQARLDDLKKDYYFKIAHILKRVDDRKIQKIHQKLRQ